MAIRHKRAEKRGAVEFWLGSVLSKRGMVDSIGRNSTEQSFMVMAVELWVIHRAMAAAIAVTQQKKRFGSGEQTWPWPRNPNLRTQSLLFLLLSFYTLLCASERIGKQGSHSAVSNSSDHRLLLQPLFHFSGEASFSLVNWFIFLIPFLFKKKSNSSVFSSF